MGDLTKRIIETLETGDLINDDESISLAYDLVCKATFETYCYDSAQIAEEEITEQEAKALENSIVLALDRYRKQNQRLIICSLLGALRKTGKSKYKKIYQQHLLQGFKNFLDYNQIVHVALLALSDCEDEITVLDWIPDEEGVYCASLGFSDHDQIAALARKYLKAIGKNPHELT
jgi:hypothetical protein